MKYLTFYLIKKCIRDRYNDENLKAKESYEDIKKYIDKNVFCEDFSLNKMASDIGYNNNYLSSLIKEIYGLSFQDLSNKLRMEKARILLLTSEMCIRDRLNTNM